MKVEVSEAKIVETVAVVEVLVLVFVNMEMLLIALFSLL